MVCDLRKNDSMREGNQSDKIDTRRLAELLRLNPRRTGEMLWTKTSQAVAG